MFFGILATVLAGFKTFVGPSCTDVDVDDIHIFMGGYEISHI